MSNFTDTYIKALKPKTARYEEIKRELKQLKHDLKE